MQRSSYAALAAACGVVGYAFVPAAACAGPDTQQMQAAAGGATGVSSALATGSIVPPLTTATSSGSSTATSSSGSGTGGTDAGSAQWDPLPLFDQLANCVGGAKLHDPSTWPKPNWQSCGVGCQVASPLDNGTTFASDYYASAAATLASVFYYRSDIADPQYRYDVIRRRPDDAAVGVLRVPEACYPAAATFAAPLVTQYFGPDAVSRWIGYYSQSRSDFMAPAALVGLNDTQRGWFSWDNGVGVFNTGGTIDVLLPSSHALQQLATTVNGTVRALGARVFWTDWTTNPTTVHMWTQADGATPLFQTPVDAIAIALSETTMAWLSATGSQVQAGGYQTGRVYWSPYATTPSGVTVHAGPDVTGQIQGVVDTFSTGGDYIVVPRAVGGDLAKSGMLVIQMSTGKLWTLKPRPGTYLVPVGMSGDEILAFESDLSWLAQYPAFFQRWLRLDLTQLDALEAGLAAGP